MSEAACDHQWKPWNNCGFTDPTHALRTCKLCGLPEFTHQYDPKTKTVKEPDDEPV